MGDEKERKNAASILSHSVRSQPKDQTLNSISDQPSTKFFLSGSFNLKPSLTYESKVMVLSNNGPLRDPQSALVTETTLSHRQAQRHNDMVDGGDAWIPSHPLGIKPLGNELLFEGQSARQCIGTFSVLPDEMLAQFLEYLDSPTLRLLGSTCRFLYAHSLSEELWKTLFLEYVIYSLFAIKHGC